MIQKLTLKDFQSHKETTLEFAPGVNVIIGPSDSGKTSIIRALRLLVWNRPLGDAFISHWSDDLTILAEFEDCIIERYKGKEDHYKLTSGKAEPLVFKAFGTEVPEEVQQAVNFSKINLQEQMDSSFLISANPGEVSRHFNKVANIDDIDSSLRAVESWVRSINSDIKAAEAEAERHEEEVAEFKYLNQMEIDLEVLEGLEENKNRELKKYHKVEKLKNEIIQIQQEITDKSELLPLEGQVAQVLELHNKWHRVITRHDKLAALINKLTEVEEEIQGNNALAEDEQTVLSLLTLHKNKRSATEEYNTLSTLIEAVRNVFTAVDKQQNKLDKLEQRWHKEAPETCPLCDGTGKLID